MSELSEKLAAQANKLEQIVGKFSSSKFAQQLDKLRDMANQAGRAWSGSWIGYHSRVYYKDFAPTPPGAHFSSEWGFQETFSGDTVGDWAEYTFDGVRDTILSSAGVSSLKEIENFAHSAEEVFQNAREEFLSVAVLSLENKSDAFLSRLKQQVEKLTLMSKFDFVEALRPKQFMSRDSLAMSQGLYVPPHIVVLSEVFALKHPSEKCEELAKIMRRTVSHLETKEHHRQEKRQVGTNVIFGHGGAPVWKDLKDFIQDRLDLPWDEFNRVPVAGITNIARLSEMLEDAAIAFIVMTAEDEQVGGKMQARMNVIHEAGLFQGKLGFTKAIVLREDGCEEFTNIEGLGQIRFPKGNIKAAFEEIRRVLEREKLIEG
jgi:predicted nucleotide-binding protein